MERHQYIYICYRMFGNIMRSMVPKRDTRQEILTEAFLMYEDLGNRKFSLSEIAAKVGISKTAIFRHFKNKDALIQVMTETVFTGLSSVLNSKDFFFTRTESKEYSFEEFSDLIDTVLSFFMEHPGYLGFTLNSGILTQKTDEPIFSILKKHGVMFSEEYINSSNLRRFFRAYFCTESIIFFLVRRNCLLKINSSEVPSDEEFKKTITDVLWNGISKRKDKLSHERRAELDKLCEIIVPEAGDDARFFMAFTEVFNEYGIEGITIERISEKLNLAKSSLYSYFNNKEEYITKMLSSELRVIMDMLSERLKAATSIEEIAYILLVSEKNYLEQRPFVLTIHSWASQQGFNLDRMTGKEKSETEDKLAIIKDKGFEIKNGLSVKTILGWVSSVIGTLKLYFKVPVETADYVGELFDLICFGLSKSISNK